MKQRDKNNKTNSFLNNGLWVKLRYNFLLVWNKGMITKVEDI